MNHMILFAIAANASPADVAEVIDSINRQFGTNSTGTISPQNIGASTPPAPPAGNVTNAAPTGELDKNGLPWDERIHSGSKAKVADGTWRAKKGIDPAYKASIEAQLRATLAGTAPSASAAIPTPPAATAAPAAPALPAIPAPPAAAAPPLPALNPAYTAFVEFIASQTKSAENPAGRITPEWTQQVLSQFGVADGSMQNLAHRADLIPQIEAAIRGALGL